MNFQKLNIGQKVFFRHAIFTKFIAERNQEWFEGIVLGNTGDEIFRVEFNKYSMTIPREDIRTESEMFQTVLENSNE